MDVREKERKEKKKKKKGKERKGKKKKKKKIQKAGRREGRNRLVRRGLRVTARVSEHRSSIQGNSDRISSQEAVMSMDGCGKAGLGCKPSGIAPPPPLPEALVRKPRKHTGSSLERIRETSRQRERQSRRLISRRRGRALERVATSFSRRPSWPGDGTRVSCIAGRLLTV